MTKTRAALEAEYQQAKQAYFVAMANDEGFFTDAALDARWKAWVRFRTTENELADAIIAEGRKGAA